MPRIQVYIVVTVVVLAGALYTVFANLSHQPLKNGTPGSQSTILASYTPPFSNGLITNEFAFWNPGTPSAKASPVWQMSSGSLYANNGVFWTGKTDSCSNDANGPNAGSTNCTDSDIFRLNTVKNFSGSLAVSLSLKQNVDIHDSNCNAHDTCWHGTHIWLRYQNQYNLYYVSVNRADGQVVIKRKVPCGPSNSGTYFVLGSYVKHDFKTGEWDTYTASVQTNPDGSVTIKLYDDSVSKTTPIATGTDHGGTDPNWSQKCTVPGHYPSATYQPISAAGGVGIRGDYANFEFTQFHISSL